MGSQRNYIDGIGELVRTHIMTKDAALRQKHEKGHARIIDMCSGSGVASRWFRQAGWTVNSVDHELYTSHWNYYALNVTPEALAHEQGLYKVLHGLPKDTDIVAWWNTMLPSLDAPGYFETHYSPHEYCQRMYFMPHIAQWLDKALHWHTSQDWSATPLLHAHFVSEVCNAMICAANTSGTMKSFHAQWGGPTGHRMGDIQTLPCIKPFWKIDGPIGTATVHDVTQPIPISADLIYFDPPASVQQFSSSYHLLNAFAQSHYRTPSTSGKHGDKSGILSGAYSSPFSKKSTAVRAWQDWIGQAQKKAPWLVVTYPANGLLSTEQVAILLQQNGKNTVSRYSIEDIYVYIVKTQNWQSPQQLKRFLIKSPEPVALGEFYNPQKLSPRFSLASSASKINVYDQNQCIAIISSRYKITWLTPPSYQDLPVWTKAQFSVSERFSQYLIDRKWLCALTALRELKKTCKCKKTYREHWNMLRHLIQAHNMRSMLGRIDALC